MYSSLHTPSISQQCRILREKLHIYYFYFGRKTAELSEVNSNCETFETQTEQMFVDEVVEFSTYWRDRTGVILPQKQKICKFPIRSMPRPKPPREYEKKINLIFQSFSHHKK